MCCSPYYLEFIMRTEGGILCVGRREGKEREGRMRTRVTALALVRTRARGTTTSIRSFFVKAKER